MKGRIATTFQNSLTIRERRFKARADLDDLGFYLKWNFCYKYVKIQFYNEHNKGF